MSLARKLLVAIFILLSFLALYGGTMAPVDEATGRAGSQIATAAYAERGPHPVGTRKLPADDETPIDLTIWYPALSSEETVANYRYEIRVIPALGASAIAVFEGKATVDAPHDRSAGPYPLLLLSPGYAFGSTAYGWLAEHLASYGFVVISPEHDEHLLTAMSDLWQSAIVRPRETLAVLHSVESLTDVGGALEGLVDAERVGVIGHSYGGYTALAVAGAQIDTKGFQSRCQNAYDSGDSAAWLCDALLPHLADMAQLAGLVTIPDSLWPAWKDTRIDAVVSLAGDAYLFDQAGMAQVSVPVMAIGGTNDGDTPYLWGTHPTYEYASSANKVRIALQDAGHMVFTGPCEAVRRFMMFVPNQFCSDEVWDRQHAHSLIKHFSTAFVLAQLKHDARAATALAPRAVSLPNVTYEAEGY